MATREFTLDDLRRILLDAAGVDESVDISGDILDQGLYDLGYESLALLETGGRIEREYNITLDDEILTEDPTPRRLIEAVNRCLSPAAPSVP